MAINKIQPLLIHRASDKDREAITINDNAILLKIGKCIEYYGNTESRQVAQSGGFVEKPYKSKV